MPDYDQSANDDASATANSEAVRAGQQQTDSSQLVIRSRIDHDWPEIAARIGELSEAGLPLPLSLRTAATTATSQATAQSLEHTARRLDQGMALTEAIRDSGLPGGQTLIGSLEAGHRVGDLHHVLEPIVRCEAVERQLRERIRASLIYPTIVVAVGLFLAWSVLRFVVVMFERYAASSGFDSETAMPLVSTSLAAVPILVLAFAIVEVLRAIFSDRVPFAWCGPVKATLDQLRFYRLTSHLAILIDAAVPLPDALEIAGQAAGGHVGEQSSQLATSIRQGRSLDDRLAQLKGAPPVMRALLGSLSLPSTDPASVDAITRGPLPLSTRLHAASDMLATSMETRLDSLNRTMSFVIAVVLGIGVLGFALALFWPLIHAYTQSAIPTELL